MKNKKFRKNLDNMRWGKWTYCAKQDVLKDDSGSCYAFKKLTEEEIPEDGAELIDIEDRDAALAISTLVGCPLYFDQFARPKDRVIDCDDCPRKRNCQGIDASVSRISVSPKSPPPRQPRRLALIGKPRLWVYGQIIDTDVYPEFRQPARKPRRAASTCTPTAQP